MEKTRFSLDDTMFCKGIAVCILLFDHLFRSEDTYSKFFYVLKIQDKPAISFFASTVAAVCVALFVFLSAYGLTASYKKSEKSDVNWIYNRVKKLYFLYWPVFLISILYGYITGLQNPFDIYESLIQFILDFFALSYCVYSEAPFSGVWWYISFALVLYIFFPFIYKVCRKFPKISLLVSFALSVKHLGFNPLIVVQLLRYAFVICLGCLFAEKNWLNLFLSKKSSWKRFLLIQILVIFAIVLRLIRAFTFDGILAVAIVLSAVEFFRIMENINIFKRFNFNKFIVFLGKHSANIFLIHGLIYRNFYQDFIYWFYYPPIIFLVLLICSLGFSIILEKIKGTTSRVVKKMLGYKKT